MPVRALRVASLVLVSAVAIAIACTPSTPRPQRPSPEDVMTPSPGADADVEAATTDVDATATDADTELALAKDEPTDPMATHYETTEGLLKLVWLPPATDEAQEKRRGQFLTYNVGASGPGRFNQGNKAIALHDVSKAKCLAGLKAVVLQTEEQKAACGGAEYMVPIYKDGKKETAKYCIDVFEFPNKPCELPMVWTAPSATMTVCSLQGKRLCTQQEWQMACRMDPEGGPDSIYAYGSELDLTACNTNKPHPTNEGGSFKCNGRSAESAWKTCETMTEPVGAFPRCRSRFGVYDQHGNVAEVMTRTEVEAGLVSQLKGSAFFYVDVARKHNEPHPVTAPRDTYPDHCNYDPRWHVESMRSALHVNYHLGFRCCKNASPFAPAADAASPTSDIEGGPQGPP